jgi:ABC-type bacteriocin/lantibiotic exporter with double-glycine peptidase domain
MTRGVCIQSTPYTCGPASAVTLLEYFGIPVTESEMAKMSHTRKWLGTEMVPLARAIAQKASARGLKTNVIPADWQRLKGLNIPCLVDIKYNLLVDHMIVVIKIREDIVTVADPITGIDYWNKDDFLKKWRGSVIVITRN